MLDRTLLGVKDRIVRKERDRIFIECFSIETHSSRSFRNLLFVWRVRIYSGWFAQHLDPFTRVTRPSAVSWTNPCAHAITAGL